MGQAYSQVHGGGGGPPTGTAGGTLSGTYPNPTLASAFVAIAGNGNTPLVNDMAEITEKAWDGFGGGQQGLSITFTDIQQASALSTSASLQASATLTPYQVGPGNLIVMTSSCGQYNSGTGIQCDQFWLDISESFLRELYDYDSLIIRLQMGTHQYIAMEMLCGWALSLNTSTYSTGATTPILGLPCHNLGTLSGNITINAPADPAAQTLPRHGQIKTFHLKTSVTHLETVTFNAAFSFATGQAATKTTALAQVSGNVKFTFYYDAIISKWVCENIIYGY